MPIDISRSVSDMKVVRRIDLRSVATCFAILGIEAHVEAIFANAPVAKARYIQVHIWDEFNIITIFKKSRFD